MTPPLLAGRRLAVVLTALVVGCSLPPEAYDEAAGSAPDAPVAQSADVGTVQLYQTGEEASLPVLFMGGRESLTLAFDWFVADGGRPLTVEFLHLTRDGVPDLLPTEYLTGFERDDLTDYRRSGVSTVPYVHYEYTFPNGRIGFELSGNYRLRVSDGSTVLFERPFFVTEQLAEVRMGFGATLAGGSSGVSIQPAARVTPGPRLDGYDAFQYTLCFARDGILSAPRCAPEPTAVDLAFFQYYLPRDAAFGPPAPLFDLDLGLLALNAQVVEINQATVPPTATLDLDYAEFGGDVQSAVLAPASVIAGAFRDVGTAGTDAEYVDVTFRYVPPSGRQTARPVFLIGGFNGWSAAAGWRMTWVPEAQRYEGTFLVKQGRYVYSYVAPGGPSRSGIAIGQPNLFTALVYLRDPQRFTDRLVAVQSSVAQ